MVSTFYTIHVHLGLLTHSIDVWINKRTRMIRRQCSTQNNCIRFVCFFLSYFIHVGRKACSVEWCQNKSFNTRQHTHIHSHLINAYTAMERGCGISANWFVWFSQFLHKSLTALLFYNLLSFIWFGHLIKVFRVLKLNFCTSTIWRMLKTVFEWS